MWLWLSVGGVFMRVLGKNPLQYDSWHRNDPPRMTFFWLFVGFGPL